MVAFSLGTACCTTIVLAMAAQLAESIGCTYHIAAHRYHSPNGRRRSGTTPGSRRCGTGPRRRGTWAYRHSDLVGRQMRRWSVGGMVAWWHGGVARPAAYLQFSSSDMSPLPQSNSPSQSQLFGMQWRLTPHRNWPSLHLGAPAGKRMRTKLSTLLTYNNNKRNDDLWRGLLVVLGLVARWSAFRPTKSCFCCCSYKSLNYFARYRK